MLPSSLIFEVRTSSPERVDQNQGEASARSDGEIEHPERIPLQSPATPAFRAPSARWCSTHYPLVCRSVASHRRTTERVGRQGQPDAISGICNQTTSPCIARATARSPSNPRRSHFHFTRGSARSSPLNQPFRRVLRMSAYERCAESPPSDLEDPIAHRTTRFDCRKSNPSVADTIAITF
jgi:hypothetical protein